MDRDKTDLKDALKSLAQAPGHAPGEHLAPAELLAYHRGQRSEAQELQIQDHLVFCPACAQLLLELSSFPELDQGEGRPISDAELSAQWLKFEGQIRPGAFKQPETKRRARFETFFSLPLPSTLAYAAAASLLIAAVALTVWVVLLRRENQRLVAQTAERERYAASLNEQVAARERAESEARRQLEEQKAENQRAAEKYETEMARLNRSAAEPGAVTSSEIAINVAAADLYPADVVRGKPEEVKTIEVAKGAQLISLTLNTTSAARFDQYALDISNQNGKLVRAINGLRKSRYDNFTIAVARQLLAAGQYSLKLFGIRDGQKEPLETYAVRIKQSN